MKPLLWKELRENVRWFPVGLIVVAIACWIAHPNLENPTGLLARDLLTQLAIVTTLLAFALGVVQAYRDLQPGPAAYLNHRGVTASQIFLAKTIAGFVIYAIAVIVPLALLAAWVWYEGMSRYPMRPAQVVPSLVFALVAFLMHPAAMLMMSRNASWWGTRVLPLVPAGAVLIPFFATLHDGGLWWATISILVSVPLLAWLIAISRQSWQDLATEPPASRTSSRLRGRWLLPTYLMIGVTIGYMTVLIFIGDWIQSYGRPRIYTPVPTQEIALDTATGEPWIRTILNTYYTTSQEFEVLGGDVIQAGGTVDAMKPLTDSDRMRPFSSFSSLDQFGSGGDGFFTAPESMFSTHLSDSYDERGYLLFYKYLPVLDWVGTLSKDGAHDPGDLSGQPFSSNPLIGRSIFVSFREMGFMEPLIDSQGVYLFDTSPLSIETLIDRPIESVGLVRVEEGHSPRLLIGSGSEIFEYQFVDGKGSDTWYKELNKEERSNYSAARSLSDLSISAKLVNSYSIPSQLASSMRLQVSLFNNTLFLAPFPTGASLSGETTEIYRIPTQGDNVTISFRLTPQDDSNKDGFFWVHLIVGFMPALLVIIVFVVAVCFYISGHEVVAPWDVIAANPIQGTTVFLGFVAATILAIWLTRRVAYRRGLSRSQTTVWSVSVLLLGLIAPLSMISIYRRVQREECSHCGKQRRVDTEICELCGEPWQHPTAQGILILDDAA